MKADDYINLYLDKAKTTSYKLETAHNFFFHSIIGACLTKPHAPFTTWNPSKDYRLHTLLIRPSGSGKAPVYELAEQLARQVDLQFATKTTMTEAGLLGTVTKKFVRYGDALYKDIIGYTEASNLFIMKGHSKTIITSLNTLLDEKREVHRTLAYGDINYNTNVTLLLTTFPNKLIYTQLQSGFMQRCFVLYEIISIKVYEEICKFLNRTVWKPKGEISLKPIVKRLCEIKNKDFKFKTTKNVRTAMNKVVKDYVKLLYGFQDVQKGILKTFMTRQVQLLHKLMCHHASLELRESLYKRDVEYAKNLCIASYRSICRYVKDHYKRDERYERVERLIGKLKEKGTMKVTLSYLSARLKPISVSELKDILQFEKDLVRLRGKRVIIKK